jgi:hypothetical protein
LSQEQPFKIKKVTLENDDEVQTRDLGQKKKKRVNFVSNTNSDTVSGLGKFSSAV